MVIYGTVVTATCDRGFILPDGNLTRSVECVEGNNSVIWNDDIENCQRKFYYQLLLFNVTYWVYTEGPYSKPGALFTKYLTIRFTLGFSSR